jgi:hypothetical protein
MSSIMETEPKKHGEYTGKLSDRLSDEPIFKANDFLLATDHGLKSESTAVPYLGRTYSSATTLSHVDIAVIDLKPPQRAFLVCEIEEEGADPKRIIGDIFSIYMANYLSVRQQKCGKKYSLNNAAIILGIRSSENSPSGLKAKSIVRKLSRMLSEEVRAGKIVYLVFGQEYDELIDKTEAKILKMTNRYLRQKKEYRRRGL